MVTQLEKQKNFLKLAFGGFDKGHTFTGENLRASHQCLVGTGITDKHFDLVLKHLKTTLQELDVVDSEIALIMETLESTRNEILGR